MSRRHQILELVSKKGIIRAEDVEAMGISRNYLFWMHREGYLERIAVGVYALPDAPVSEGSTLAEVATRMPRAVVCLVSALNFHGITSQLSPEIWLTIPRGSWKPDMQYPPLNLTYVSEPAYSFGIQEHVVNGVLVKVYSPAKTVADCFKFRSKVGLDIAIEGLREAWRSRKVTMDELMEAAEVNRVSKVMRPYLEAVV
ncbi:AbiEi antitoxin N-terminal domain-containing protein [Desulfurispirillum indicum]|uniref:type IV toxin-antitoxin system AbiEi family antitoxin domain-containing protein n=1 Tax=Desulfurispirillum indicum TaxID=936456 RepID=UPI001CFA03C3|nr:AbiEi antitoxin N-terminal domain-containing protein [Desulfurispirillum indicum]UCZ57501.1 AbiEi antitoxin N-terminal domain-containing protein [Desulfurispirillum indicum]